MTDLLIVAILLLLVGIAISRIIKAKKSGTKCMGCPHEGSCRTRKERPEGCIYSVKTETGNNVTQKKPHPSGLKGRRKCYK